MEALLQDILDQLKSQAKPSIPLGLGFAPKKRYIYANRQHSDCLWYFWNGSSKTHEPIKFDCITGFIEKVDAEEKIYLNKPDLKVNIHIRADQLYVIQASIGAVFMKGLIFALSTLPAEDFQTPFTIAVEPGDSETDKVLLSRLYSHTGSNIFAPYDKSRKNWDDILSCVIEKVHQVWGDSISNSDEPQESLPVQDPVKSVQAEKKKLAPTTARKIVETSSQQVNPVQEVNPLTGQGLVIAESNSVSDEIRSKLRSAETLRDFSEIRKLLTMNSEHLGPTIVEVLLQNIEAANQKKFPAKDLGNIKTIIIKAKELLDWTPDDFSAFVSDNFSGCQTTAHLTFNQMCVLAEIMERKTNLGKLKPVKAEEEDYDSIPF